MLNSHQRWHHWMCEQSAYHFKVAKHSFSGRFCWCNLARAQGFQKTNMSSTERSFYLLNTRTICVIFLCNYMQCVMALVFYYNDMLQKVTMQRTQQFSSFVCYWNNPVKCNTCAVAWKIETNCFSRNMPFSNDPVIRISSNLAKSRSETMWMVYHEKSEFWLRGFLTIQETINGELRKSPMSKFS